jgi:hypothetical protein
MCEKILNEKEKKKTQRERMKKLRHTHRQRKGKEGEFYSNNSNSPNVVMPFLTYLSIHIQFIIRNVVHMSEVFILSNCP